MKNRIGTYQRMCDIETVIERIDRDHHYGQEVMSLSLMYYGHNMRHPAETICREGRNSQCLALYTTLKTYVHLPSASK